MSGSVAAKSSKEKTAEQGFVHGEARAPGSVSTGVYADVLRLQRTAGNRAVNSLFSKFMGCKDSNFVDLREGLQSSGEPLDPEILLKMEQALGHDLSDVRVHTHATAASTAENLNADAYTVGQDIVFGAGRYRPDSDSGEKLLAHELFHTLQQTNSAGKAPGLAPSGRVEHEANTAAGRVVSGQAISSPTPTGIGLARQFRSLNVYDLDDAELGREIAIVGNRVSKPESYPERESDEEYLKKLVEEHNRRLSEIALSSVPPSREREQIVSRQDRPKQRPERPQGTVQEELRSTISELREDLKDMPPETKASLEANIKELEAELSEEVEKQTEVESDLQAAVGRLDFGYLFGEDPSQFTREGNEERLRELAADFIQRTHLAPDEPVFGAFLPIATTPGHGVETAAVPPGREEFPDIKTELSDYLRHPNLLTKLLKSNQFSVEEKQDLIERLIEREKAGEQVREELKKENRRLNPTRYLVASGEALTEEQLRSERAKAELNALTSQGFLSALVFHLTGDVNLAGMAAGLGQLGMTVPRPYHPPPSAPTRASITVSAPKEPTVTRGRPVSTFRGTASPTSSTGKLGTARPGSTGPYEQVLFRGRQEEIRGIGETSIATPPKRAVKVLAKTPSKVRVSGPPERGARISTEREGLPKEQRKAFTQKTSEAGFKSEKQWRQNNDYIKMHYDAYPGIDGAGPAINGIGRLGQLKRLEWLGGNPSIKEIRKKAIGKITEAWQGLQGNNWRRNRRMFNETHRDKYADKLGFEMPDSYKDPSLVIQITLKIVANKPAGWEQLKTELREISRNKFRSENVFLDIVWSDS